MKKGIIVGILLIAVILLVMNWDKVRAFFGVEGNGKKDDKVDINAVSLNDMQSTIDQLTVDLASANSDASTGDTDAVNTSIDINKKIQILKLQQKVNIKFSPETVTILLGFSLAELINFNAMSVSELVDLYNTSFQNYQP